jgi:hypothetical protein
MESRRSSNRVGTDIARVEVGPQYQGAAAGCRFFNILCFENAQFFARQYFFPSEKWSKSMLAQKSQVALLIKTL